MAVAGGAHLTVTQSASGRERSSSGSCPSRAQKRGVTSCNRPFSSTVKMASTTLEQGGLQPPLPPDKGGDPLGADATRHLKTQFGRHRGPQRAVELLSWRHAPAPVLSPTKLFHSMPTPRDLPVRDALVETQPDEVAEITAARRRRAWRTRAPKAHAHALMVKP
jgi:hypothetical protein